LRWAGGRACADPYGHIGAAVAVFIVSLPLEGRDQGWGCLGMNGLGVSSIRESRAGTRPTPPPPTPPLKGEGRTGGGAGACAPTSVAATPAFAGAGSRPSMGSG